MSSSRSRSRSRNRTEAPRLNNFNVTESSRMFGGSATLNTTTNKPNPFDDDDSDDGGEGMDAGGEGIAMFMKGGDNKGGESKPNPFDDSDSEDDGIMTNSLIKAGQDTAQSSPDRSQSFDNNKDNNSPSSLGNDNSPSSLGNASAGNRVGPFNSPNNDDDEYNSNEEEDEGPLTPQDIEEWHSNSQKGSPPDDNTYPTADKNDNNNNNTNNNGGEKKGYYNLSKPNEHSQFMSNQTGSSLSLPHSSNNGGDANKLSYVSEKSKESSDDSLNILTHRTSSSINYGQNNNTDTSGNNNGSSESSRRYSTNKSSNNISGIIDTDLTTGISRGGVEEGGEQYASMQELIDDEQRSRASFTASNHRRRGKCGWCIDSTIGMKSTKRRKISLCLILLLILGGIIGIVVWLTTGNSGSGEESIESNKNKEFESKDNPQVEILDTDGGGGNNGTATDIDGGSNEGMKNETNNKDNEEGKGTDFDGLDLTFTFTTDMPSLAPSSTTGNRTGGEPTNDNGGVSGNSGTPTISTAPTPTVMGIDVMDNDDDDIFGTWSDDTSLPASQELNGTDVSLPTATVNSTNSSNALLQPVQPEEDPSSYLNVTSLDDDMLSDINVISFNDTTSEGGSLSPTMSASPSGVGIPSLPTSMGPTSSDMSYSPTLSNRPTTSLSIYPPPSSTNTTNLITTVTESKLQITIPGNLTLSNLKTPTTVNEQELLISVLEQTIMDVMNQDVLVNEEEEEEVIVKDVVILRINGVDVVNGATDVDDVGLDISGDSPPRVPSSDLGMPSDPEVDNAEASSDACIICPNGITAGDDHTPYINDGDTTTCKELVDITALTFTKDDESCKGSMIMEVYCCPIVQENPCLICGSNGGLSIDKEDEMPFIDEGDMMTCKVSSVIRVISCAHDMVLLFIAND